jgi:predicted nucleic acid-binding protein
MRAEQEAAEAARSAASEEERNAAIDRAAEAAREAEEAMAAAALAPAAPTRSEPVRSDAGATVSGKQEWRSEVEDYAKAFRAVKDDAKVREAIDAAAARLVRAGKREIPGVRIWPVAKANFR